MGVEVSDNEFEQILYLCFSYMVCIFSISAMQWMDEDVDLDEVECILSNLIYQGKIKGYISHEKRTLIISKADPFPKAGVMKV